MLLFRKRVHSSASLFWLLPLSGGLITVVLPPAVLSWLVAVAVSEELSWKGPLLMTMMKFFSQLFAETGEL